MDAGVGIAWRDKYEGVEMFDEVTGVKHVCVGGGEGGEAGAAVHQVAWVDSSVGILDRAQVERVLECGVCELEGQ